ncbi:MAG: hypothetical protein JXQ29_05775 [Planctomycetes bacterium]|nr:hypothetical protein [Planctomycetota bacterium]
MRPEPGARCRPEGLERRLRIGYLAVGVFLAAFLLRRGVDFARDRVLLDPRFAFAPPAVQVLPRPNWVGRAYEEAVRRQLEPLAGCSVLHPGFRSMVAASLGRVPWIRSVEQVQLGAAGEQVVVRVVHRQPVACLGDGAGYVDRAGCVLPAAGVALKLPWLASAGGSLLDPVQRFVAAQEAAFLLARTGGRGAIWDGLCGIEAVAERRLDDGPRYSLLSLVFARSDPEGRCRIRWGRGRAEARPCDPSCERKFAELLRIFEQYPRWRGVEEGSVAFERTVVRLVGALPTGAALLAGLQP